MIEMISPNYRFLSRLVSNKHMNIELQCCGLFVLSVILIMFMREKKLDLMDRRLFIRAILTCFACLIFDITSIIAINYAVLGCFSPIITDIICKIYIMLLTLQGYFSYVYVSTGLLTIQGVNESKMRKLYRWLIVIGEVAMLILPIDYFCEGRVVYSSGPATLVAYALCGIYLIASVAICIVFRGKMSGRRFVALMTWQITWLCAAVIQFLFPQLLIVGFASAFGMVILYIQLENPSAYIDIFTGLFTNDALSIYIRDRYKYNMPFSVFTAKIKYLTKEVDYYMEQDTIMRAVKALNELGPEPAFRIEDKLFCVAYDDPERMQERMHYLKKRRDSITDIPAEAAYILVPDSRVFSNSEEFFKFLHYHENDTQEITIADEENVREMRERSFIREMIDNALTQDRVEVFYQPFYNVKTKKFTAAEALVRIRNADGGIVPPGVFIPVAEKSGQIIPLGVRIFEKVCQFLSTGEAQKYGIEFIDVNLSAAQFDYENPAKFVLDYIHKYNVDPSLINLEITETAQQHNKKTLMMNIEKLTKEGITFSLDDFGTGRSNLDYFVDMPIKTIKFDYSFTQGYFQNDKIKHVFEGVADMMHDMGISLVSEGVETKEQMEVMTGLGVEYIQGYYFSKPVPENEFIDFLKNSLLSTPYTTG